MKPKFYIVGKDDVFGAIYETKKHGRTIILNGDTIISDLEDVRIVSPYSGKELSSEEIDLFELLKEIFS